VVLAVGVLIVLPLVLPEHLRLGPSWLSATLSVLLLVTLLAVSWTRHDREATLVRVLAIGLTVVLIAGAAWMTGRVITDLVRGGPSVSSASVLLSTGGLVWVNNSVLFGLMYWEMDGGGPLDRDQGRPGPHRRDFAFPQHTSPELGDPGWLPSFVDYLYVAFTNGVAFSPTDTMPLTPTAKLTMAAQALISFVVVGLVIARAVNVLT
jgi:uncharacterized membrane protein